MTSPRYTHAVVYTGAPYHDGEGGHIVSLHKGADHVKIDARLGYDLRLVHLDEPYRNGKTARQYFANAGDGA